MTIKDMESVLKGYDWIEEDYGIWHKDGGVFTLCDDGFVHYEGEEIAVGTDVEDIVMHGPYSITIYLTNGKVEIDL